MGMRSVQQYAWRVAAVAGLSLIGLVGSADLLAAQSQPKATPVVARGVAPLPVLSPLLKTPTDFLLQRMSAHVTLPHYLDLLHRDFRAADVDGDGAISEADDVLAVQLARATFRAMYLAELMRADLDGDGVVTEAELRTTLRHDYNDNADTVPETPTPDQQIENTIRQFMAADADHDGRITLDEARTYVASTPDFQALGTTGAGNARALLFFRPEGQSALTVAGLDAAAEKLFRNADTDGDGVISPDELKPFAHPVPQSLRPFGPALPQMVRAEPPKPQPDTAAHTASNMGGGACPIPLAKLSLIGGNETAALPDTSKPFSTAWIR
jgi:Ca2+-binding EF-hand superfamily protein